MERTRAPVLTLLVSALAVAGFALQGSDAARSYGAFPPALYAFELHRLITVNFVHLSPPHLINNVVFLVVIGAMVERRFPRWLWVTLVFGGTAVGALIAALYWDHWLGGGLSGGVCALTAFLLATDPAPFRLKAVGRTWPLWTIVIFYLLVLPLVIVPLTGEQVLHLAHGAGAAIGAFVGLGERAGHPRRAVAILAAVIAMLCGNLAYAPWRSEWRAMHSLESPT